MCVVPDTECASHFPVQSPSWPAGDLQIFLQPQEGRGRRKGWQRRVELDSTAPLDMQRHQRICSSYCNCKGAQDDTDIWCKIHKMLALFFRICIKWFILLLKVFDCMWRYQECSLIMKKTVPCPSFWILINSLSISHSTQASIAPVLVSFDCLLLSHFMLAASSEHEAYNLTSCGVLATPPTMICKLGWFKLGT